MKSVSFFLIFISALLISACKLDQNKIVDIDDAENLLYTDDGRLIVSGKKNIYLVSHDAAGYHKKELYPEGGCMFDGIAQWGKWVFATCNRGLTPWKLFAAGLQDNGDIHFAEIGTLPGFILANGMAFSPQGDLLMADTNIAATTNFGLAKIKINHDAMPDYNDPNPVFDATKIIGSINKKWLDLNPNGVRVKGNFLYVTALNRVLKYKLDANGEVLTEQVLATQNAYLDDLYPLCGGAIVANFSLGSIFYVDKNGYINPNYRTEANSLGGPTAVLISKEGLYSPAPLIVTETGIPFEFSGKLGDRLINLDMGVDFAAMEAACSEDE